MTLISLLCLILFLVIFFSGFKRNSDFFSPARIFGIVWTFAIGLAEFKFSRLQFQWDAYGWFVFLLGLVTFILGTYISFVNNINRKFLDVKTIRKIIRIENINESLTFRLIMIFFLLYSICFIAEYLIQGYIPAFTALPDKARSMYGVFGIQLIVNGVNTILFLIVEYYILVKGNKTKKIFLGFVLFISFVSFSLLLQRYNFFILGMMVLCLLYYSGKYVRFRTIFLLLVTVITLLVVIRNMRVGKLAELYLYTTSQMKVPYKYAIISEPYTYIVMNLENFVQNFPKIEQHSYGLFTADFLTALTGLKHWISEYFGLVKFPHYIPSFNTFPFYWVYYYDFGLIGLAFFPFLIGYFISEVYYFLHRNPSLFTLALYSIGFSVIVISYSSDPLTRLDMVFNYIAIAFVQRFISGNRKSNELTNTA